MSGDDVDTKAYRDGGVTVQQISQPSGQKITLQNSNLRSRFYTMNFEERGKALVINNIKFDNPMFNRNGQDTDATSMYQRFQDLEFDTELMNDASKEEILKKIKDIAKEDHSHNDCFACAILTHGDKSGLWATDKVIDIKDIMAAFNASNCPTLANKPKLFVIQASQGSDYDDGHDGNVADADGENSEYRPVEKMKIPNDSDFLFVYSSAPGKVSSTNKDKGSIFINTMSDELRCMDPEEDFYRVLTRVCNRVAKYEYDGEDRNFRGKKQMPCFVSMLTKPIKFGTK